MLSLEYIYNEPHLQHFYHTLKMSPKSSAHIVMLEPCPLFRGKYMYNCIQYSTCYTISSFWHIVHVKVHALNNQFLQFS